MPKLSLTIALRTPWSFFIVAHKSPYYKLPLLPTQCLLHYLLQRQTSFPIFCLFLPTLFFFLKFLFRATSFLDCQSSRPTFEALSSILKKTRQFFIINRFCFFSTYCRLLIQIFIVAHKILL